MCRFQWLTHIQTYWNLDGFANNETALALNHSLWLPYGGQRVGTDPILIPTGDILANAPQSVNDFWTAPKQLGANFTNPALLGNCGANCTGYDTCFLTNRQQPYDWRQAGPVARLRSAWSGIQVDVFTDQEAFQVYSCGGMNGGSPSCIWLRIKQDGHWTRRRRTPRLTRRVQDRWRSSQRRACSMLRSGRA